MRATIVVVGLGFATVAACATAGDANPPETVPPTTAEGTVPLDASNASDTGAGSDAGADGRSTADSPNEAAPPLPDSGPPVCAPGDTTSFVPAFKPPTPFHQNKCDATQIAAYYTNCLPPNGSASACAPWRSANTQCAQCIATPETAASLGPVILRTNGLVTINIAGCVGNATGDLSNTGCSFKEQRAMQCVNFACDPYCGTSTPAELAAYQQCTVDAENGPGCSTFASETQLCRSQLTGQAAQCVNQTSFQDYYNFIVPLFCGP
jgi:hypothetical protein